MVWGSGARHGAAPDIRSSGGGIAPSADVADTAPRIIVRLMSLSRRARSRSALFWISKRVRRGPSTIFFVLFVVDRGKLIY